VSPNVPKLSGCLGFSARAAVGVGAGASAGEAGCGLVTVAAGGTGPSGTTATSSDRFFSDEETEASSFVRDVAGGASAFDEAWGERLCGLLGVQPASANNSALAQPRTWRLSERRVARDEVTTIMRLVTPDGAKSSARRSDSRKLRISSEKSRLASSSRKLW